MQSISKSQTEVNMKASQKIITWYHLYFHISPETLKLLLRY